MVRSGSFTLSAGTVADSRPRSAQRVSVAAAVVPSRVIGTSANDARVSRRRKKPPTSATASRGSSFRTVVTAWTQPAARTP